MGKESTCNAGEKQETRIRSLEREDPPGGEHVNPLQYSFFFFLWFQLLYILPVLFLFLIIVILMDMGFPGD